MLRHLLVLAVAGIAAPAFAQSQLKEFPPGLTTPSDDVIKRRFDDRNYRVDLADGTNWKLQYKANGYYFVNTSTGYSDSGKWSVKDGFLCNEPRKTTGGCNEVRDGGDASFWIKRANGDILQMRPQ